MAVIKYHAIKRDANGKIIDEQWVPIYADAINNRARRDYNLSDLHDVSAARKNLGLVGDVTNISNSHNHDARYNAWRLEDKQANASARAALEASLTHDLTSFKTETNSKVDSFTTSFTQLNAATNQRLTAEINDRVSAVNSLTARLDSTDRTLSVESSERKSMDSNLQSQINTNKVNIQTNKENIASTSGKLAAETTNRTNADNALSSRINDVNSTLTTKLSNEATNRTNVDNALSARITTNANNLTTEISARKSEDGALSKRITDNKDTLNSHGGTLTNHGTRISSLEAKGNNHETRIGALETKTTNAANAITTETTNRAAADKNLSARITAHEQKFWIQGKDPGSAAPNNSIWFNTSSKVIYYRSGNSWIPFAGTWLS